MIAFAQYLHDLHGQHDDTELARFFFWLSDAKIQLPAADDHLPDNMINAIRMHAGGLRDQSRDVAPDTAQELSRALGSFSARFG